jgi:hypothetical protein
MSNDPVTVEGAALRDRIEALEPLEQGDYAKGFNICKTLARKIVTESTESAAIQPAGRRKATDAEVAEWAERYDITNRLGSTAREAFEDAETLHMTWEGQPEAKAEQASSTYCKGCDLNVTGPCGSTDCDQRQSAPIEAGELPPLPKAERELIELHQPTDYTTHVCTSARYTADAMRAYGQLCRDTKPESVTRGEP